jgi:hypothetical protein
MTSKEFKALAYSIGTSGTPAVDILGLAIQIANNLQWAGERRKVWLAAARASLSSIKPKTIHRNESKLTNLLQALY